MRLVFISDTHGFNRGLELPEGDFLVHAGDLTKKGRPSELQNATDWLRALPHRHKVLIAGNHDFCLETPTPAEREMLRGLSYLRDESLELDGVLFYGSPWQPWFYNWAFNLPRGEALARVWRQIPGATQVLITHGPPLGILDRTFDGREVGCQDLLERVLEVQPQLHLFGHIHESYGSQQMSNTLYLNGSICDLEYRPKRRPWVVDWDGKAWKLSQRN